MNARQRKKFEVEEKLQELEVILSAHWERQITKTETIEALDDMLSRFKITAAKTAQIIDIILTKNAENNNRFLKRKKMFSVKSVAIELFAKAKNFAK